MNGNGTNLARVLVVSGEPATLRSVRDLLEGSSSSYYRTEIVTGCTEVVKRVQQEPLVDLVLLELLPNGRDGLHTLEQLRKIRAGLPVIVLSSSPDKRQRVEAIRLGAQGYLANPFPEDELHQLLQCCLNTQESPGETTEPVTEVEELTDEMSFVAAGPAMHKVRGQAELLANINAPVLILGESGVGKEVAAHLIHKLSSRSRYEFLKVNCAALPGELLESELFGHERGAFTGAIRTKPGKFELCHKGTILLDEIGEIPASLQAKLLHVLQDKQFSRVGGDTTIEVDVRILAATNINIDQALAEKKLREDLYYRLSAFTIYLPPLRQRREEIPLLLRHFMNRMAKRYARPPLSFPAALLEACLRHPWPGNLRELENFVKRYLVMGDASLAVDELRSKLNGTVAVAGDLVAKVEEPMMRKGNGNTAGEEIPRNLKLLVRSLKDETEIHAITRALEKTSWNRKRAARLLNISYRGLLYKIHQHSLVPPRNTDN